MRLAIAGFPSLARPSRTRTTVERLRSAAGTLRLDEGKLDGADGFRPVALAPVCEMQRLPLLEQRVEGQRFVRRLAARPAPPPCVRRPGRAPWRRRRGRPSSPRAPRRGRLRRTSRAGRAAWPRRERIARESLAAGQVTRTPRPVCSSSKTRASFLPGRAFEGFNSALRELHRADLGADPMRTLGGPSFALVASVSEGIGKAAIASDLSGPLGACRVVS